MQSDFQPQLGGIKIDWNKVDLWMIQIKIDWNKVDLWMIQIAHHSSSKGGDGAGCCDKFIPGLVIEQRLEF